MLRRLLLRARPVLRAWYQRLAAPPLPNLDGDRHIENSWVAANLPEGPGRALDFGAGESSLGLIAARRGFEVTAIDLRRPVLPWSYPGLRYLEGDLFSLDLQAGEFDLVINCSAVEHVGLAGRYGVTEARADGDLEAMHHLEGLLAPGGTMILTVPVGRDAVFAPLHRIYGEERLPRLLAGFTVVSQEYWTKDEENRWQWVGRDEALRRPPTDHCYGLGLFVLRRGAQVE